MSELSALLEEFNLPKTGVDLTLHLSSFGCTPYDGQSSVFGVLKKQTISSRFSHSLYVIEGPRIQTQDQQILFTYENADVFVFSEMFEYSHSVVQGKITSDTNDVYTVSPLANKLFHRLRVLHDGTVVSRTKPGIPLVTSDLFVHEGKGRNS